MTPGEKAIAEWTLKRRAPFAAKTVAPNAILDQVWLDGVRVGIQLTCEYVGAGPASAIGDEIGIGGVTASEETDR